MPSQNVTSEQLPAIRLKLPATSANLGPGFDALGLALSLYLTIEAEQAEFFQIEASGRDKEICSQLSNNLILMTYTEVLGHQGLSVPPLKITLHNEIPLGMGCGSSAAALLGGVFLANHFGQLRWTPQQILEEACQREGHPDNVAACFYGGMTASATTTTDSIDRGLRVTAATVGRDIPWSFLLALPHAGLETSKARALLPDAYSRRDVTTNLQATALLVAAFALDRSDLLQIAMRDSLHQPFRLSVCPLLGALQPLSGQHGILGVALSGAGPSVLLITSTPSMLPWIGGKIAAAGGSQLAELLPLRVGEPAMSSLSTR